MPARAALFLVPEYDTDGVPSQNGIARDSGVPRHHGSEPGIVGQALLQAQVIPAKTLAGCLVLWASLSWRSASACTSV